MGVTVAVRARGCGRRLYGGLCLRRRDKAGALKGLQKRNRENTIPADCKSFVRNGVHCCQEFVRGLRRCKAVAFFRRALLWKGPVDFVFVGFSRPLTFY